MPNQIGAFLKASKVFAALGINMTRVNYNKAVDSHTLFIDAEGSEEQLQKADAELKKIGYLQSTTDKTSIVLLEFCMENVAGSITNLLTLINDFHFNISYINSQESSTDYQNLQLGLYVEDFGKLSAFLRETEKICNVRVIDYNRTEKIYDNSIFYSNYVTRISSAVAPKTM